MVIYKKVPTFAVEKYRFLYRDGTFFGIRISTTTTYLRRGQRAFFPVFSRENRRIRVDIIPAGCYRNLFATCRLKSGIPMSGERPRRSGSNAPARFGSGCGFRPEGEGEAVIRAQTGAWPFLEIGGFLQKNGNYRSKQGCTTRNGRTYAAWRTVERTTMESNASSAIRVLFPDRDERGRIEKRTTRFRIHYAPKTKNLTYH